MGTALVMPTNDWKMLMPRTAASLQRAFRKPNAVVLRTGKEGETQSRAFHEAMLIPPNRHKRAIIPDSLLPNIRKKQLTQDMTLDPADQKERAIRITLRGEEGEDTIDGERDEKRLATAYPVSQGPPEESPNHHPKIYNQTCGESKENETITASNAHILLSAGQDEPDHEDLHTVCHESQPQHKVQAPLELPVTTFFPEMVVMTMRRRRRMPTSLCCELSDDAECGAGHRGALEALEVLSGSQKVDAEEGQHRSQVEAWEEALSYLEAQGDLREMEQEFKEMAQRLPMGGPYGALCGMPIGGGGGMPGGSGARD
ncbi:hypothetical protein FQN60_007364 [Etheostoma spectabile]|uniref:Uncharacterized protein n=1 Tax=Etheostoma spectabile TaxID=54343 RepID=A0A5J5CZR7_9PERO|nr:hypothetical protein FQN60_007364 [Etheostoma spectabile]